MLRCSYCRVSPAFCPALAIVGGSIDDAVPSIEPAPALMELAALCLFRQLAKVQFPLSLRLATQNVDFASHSLLLLTIFTQLTILDCGLFATIMANTLTSKSLEELFDLGNAEMNAILDPFRTFPAAPALNEATPSMYPANTPESLGPSVSYPEYDTTNPANAAEHPGTETSRPWHDACNPVNPAKSPGFALAGQDVTNLANATEYSGSEIPPPWHNGGNRVDGFEYPGVGTSHASLHATNAVGIAEFRGTELSHAGHDTTTSCSEQSPLNAQLPSPATSNMNFAAAPQLKFKSIEAAKEALRSSKQQIVVVDSTLPQTAHEQCAWVTEIVSCMYNVKDVTDNEGLVRAWEKTVGEKGDQIEIRAWELLVGPTSETFLPSSLTPTSGSCAEVTQP